MTQNHDGTATSVERGQILLDIANTIVKLHKQYFGKGPTKARTHLSQDLLTVVLEGGFTRCEHTLRDRGHEREVIATRYAMQRSIQDEFVAAIEGVTGRRVRSFMSANDPEQDMQVEVFVFDRED